MSVTGPLVGARADTGGVYFTDLLRRRWWMVLLAVCLGIGGGYGAGARQAPVYTSTTQVLVLPTASDSDEVNLDTEAQLVTSMRTAERAATLADLGVPAAALAARVEITVPPNSEVLEISFSAGTPERAQRGAAAFAEAYLAQRAEAADADAAEWIDALRDRIADLRQQQASEPAIEALERELALRQATPNRPGEVISPATLPTSPSSPNRLLYLLSGLVAGLLAGLGAALAAHRLDPRVAAAVDLPAELADQVVMDLSGRPLTPLVAGGTTQLGRQFARLRTTVAARSAPQPRGAAAVWLVCAARGGTGAGVVTANLAAALARTGQRVVVVAADPDSSLLTALSVAPDATAGLAGALAGTAPVTGLLAPALTAPAVSVLPPGALASLAELPMSDMDRVLGALRAHADHVLLETRPLDRTADATTLGAAAAAVVLVVEKRLTRRAEVRAAALDLTRVGAPVVGVALVPGRWRARGRNRRPPRPPVAGPVRARAAVPMSSGERPG